MRMLRLVLFVAATQLATFAALAGEDLRVRFDGRDLNPGDKYSVEVNVDFVVLDWKKATKRADGSRAFSSAMIDYKSTGATKAKWQAAVPKGGKISGPESVVAFDRPIRVVPERLTQFLVTIYFSREGTGPKGESIAFNTTQTFPVSIESEADLSKLCVIFQGLPGALLTVGVRKDCEQSILSSKEMTMSIPSKR